jgi:hypothetical protein
LLHGGVSNINLLLESCLFTTTCLR